MNTINEITRRECIGIPANLSDEQIAILNAQCEIVAALKAQAKAANRSPEYSKIWNKVIAARARRTKALRNAGMKIATGSSDCVHFYA